MRCADSGIMARLRRRMNRRPGQRERGRSSKVRSLLDAGECHDLNGERQLAMNDYHNAIVAGPNTSRGDSARKYLREAYSGN